MLRSALRVLTLSGLVIAGTSSPAAAEWQFAPLIGWTFKGNTTLADPEVAVGNVHWTFGGAATLIGSGPLGAEALFIYMPGFFQNEDALPVVTGRVTGSRTLALMGNVVLATPRGWNEYGLRPFVSGGLGLLHAHAASDLLPFNQNLAGINVGGGAVGFISDSTGLRFDLRYFRHLKPVSPSREGTSFGDVRLSYWAASVGVVFRY